MHSRAVVALTLLAGCDLYFHDGTSTHDANPVVVLADAHVDEPGSVVTCYECPADAAVPVDAAPSVPDAASPDAASPDAASPDAALPDAPPPSPTLCDRFTESISFPGGFNPQAVQAADFDGDGRLDLAVANFSSADVMFFRNLTPPGASTATFGPPERWITGDYAVLSQIADMNFDGKPDFVVGTGAIDFFMDRWTNPDNPNFFLQTLRSSTGGPSAFTVADFDGDGKPDIATTADTPTGVAIRVYINRTSPGAEYPNFWDPVDVHPACSPSALATSDVNGDGVVDLVVGQDCLLFGQAEVAVFIGQTHPGEVTARFRDPVGFPTSKLPVQILAGDFNRDWRPDLAVVAYDGGATTVSFNQTGFADTVPVFTPGVDINTGDYPFIAAVGDVDADGLPDLLTVFQSENGESHQHLAIAHNLTPTNATTPVFETCSIPGAWTGVATADLNGDGALDLVLTGGGSNLVHVFLAH